MIPKSTSYYIALNSKVVFVGNKKDVKSYMRTHRLGVNLKWGFAPGPGHKIGDIIT